MQPKGEELAVTPVLLTAAHINKILNLDSSPQKLNYVMKVWGKARLENSNSMKYFLGIDSLSVGLEKAQAKI